jgi:hypothetical protein
MTKTLSVEHMIRHIRRSVKVQDLTLCMPVVTGTQRACPRLPISRSRSRTCRRGAPRFLREQRTASSANRPDAGLPPATWPPAYWQVGSCHGWNLTNGQTTAYGAHPPLAGRRGASAEFGHLITKCPVTSDNALDEHTHHNQSTRPARCGLRELCGG